MSKVVLALASTALTVLALEFVLRFAEGAKAEEWPRAIVWGGVEEPVDVMRSWNEERDGAPMRRFRLSLQDGSLLDVSRVEPDGMWSIEREAEDGIV